jgi:acid phosphatase
VEAIFHTGDLNQRGKAQSEYDSFKEIISPLKAPFYVARGNHEKDLALFLDNFSSAEGRSYYSVVHDSLKFVVLDSNLSLLPNTGQYRWMLNELESADLPIVLILHHPIFSSGYHGDELGLQYYLPQLLKKHRVAAVISGHEHSFEHLRWEGLNFFVSGGGGAPLRERENHDPRSLYFNMTHHYNLLSRKSNSLLWQCFDLQGNLLYECNVYLP